MDAEMLHQEEVAQQGPPLDPETLALSQHEWLQFEPQSAVWTRCRRILRMSVPTPRCIDWGLLADAGEAAAVREEDDEELPPDIEFSLCGQHFEMSIERFAVHLGIYYEPETVRDDFAQGLTQGEEGVMRAWYQIRPSPAPGSRSEPGVGDDDRSVLSALTHCWQACNLARCFALYYASFYHRQERGTLWGGAFVTHIARSRGMVGMLEDLPAIEPRKLDRRTVLSMKLAADIPGLGLRFIGLDGRPFQPAQVIVLPDQQQQQDGGPIPEPEPIREEPVLSPSREEESPQHPPHVYRAVRLTEPLEALLHQIAARCDETAQRMARIERRLDRYEDLVPWTVASEHARRDGTQLPPFPEPCVYADDGSDAGPSGS
ncbi:hypothetical protein E3N88_15350 [Mikania micrantha]|uniref:Uncharacterized protein n=1 Tax=Mikania micrantha TaxID=192012 RepID=A0A5N6NV44_9ASTR|nr:hypothetical protein E3N88_15350 [Mikania micrantha]